MRPAILLMTLIVGLGMSGSRPVRAAGQEAVPPVAAQDASLKLVKDIYRIQYADNTAAGRRKLAADLISQAGQTPDDPTARFVLLREARDVATQAGDASVAFDAIERIEQSFAVDGSVMRSAAFAALASKVSAADAPGLAAKGLDLLERLMAGDAWAAAGKLAGPVQSVVNRTKDDALKSRGKDVLAMLAEYDRAKLALERLKTEPTDPAVNLAAGRFYCFVRDDFERGVPLLARGSDVQLKAIAAADQSDPGDPEGQKVVGDTWFAYAQGQTGLVKGRASSRAAEWYRQAYPGLTGLTKMAVGKRIEALSREGPRTKVTIYWNCADDADVYLNGKPLREYRPDFRTRADEAHNEYSVQTLLGKGDVFTIGARRGGSYGVLLIAADEQNRIVWKTDAKSWKVYEPPTDEKEWMRPEVAAKSKTSAVFVQPAPWIKQAALNKRFDNAAEPIWLEGARIAHLVSVVK